MILVQNIRRLAVDAKSHERVLDVGGWYRPFGPATHVIDREPYATRRTHEPLAPGEPERFNADTWTVWDVCNAPWPYPDGYFNFSICSHLLEDVHDPATVCRELQRVSKAGYIETPSRLREIFVKRRRRRIFKLTEFEVGFYHHRWFVELTGDHFTFTPKPANITSEPNWYITARETGRKLTADESGICLWWEDHFKYTIGGQPSLESLNDFKNTALTLTVVASTT